MPRNARTTIGNKDLRLGSRQIARHLLLTRGLIPTVLKERHAFTFTSRLDAAKVHDAPTISYPPPDRIRLRRLAKAVLFTARLGLKSSNSS